MAGVGDTVFSMRILHTADWHLGHLLHDLPRTAEHATFLAWLEETLAAERVDALLIAGDVFDTSNPPASAQAAWYGFLARLHARFPRLQVVVVGGNHDSPSRLDAPAPLLASLRVRVVGGLPRGEAGALDLDRLLVPLKDADGRVAAWVAAVPFLRPADLPHAGPPVGEAEGDALIEGVRRVYGQVLDAARARREPGQAIVAAGHCYMVGTQVSELSERKVLGGNQHALPVDVFPDDVAYVALGHLHLAQAVGGRRHVRYSGSPIPLSMGEAGYVHQVALVELDGEGLADVRALKVPRTVDMLRVPTSGPATLPEVLALLRMLDDAGDAPLEGLPYLQVDVRLPRPEPGLRRQVEEALAGKAARLVKLVAHHTGDGAALGDVVVGTDLRALNPEDVFLRRWRRDHGDPPPPDLLAAFHELVEAAHGGEA